MSRPAAASSAPAAGVVAQDLFLGVHLGAGLADPAEPLEQRSLAMEHLASFQEQVAAGNQIQPAFIIGGMITLFVNSIKEDQSENKMFI